jgi:hypothetical protein
MGGRATNKTKRASPPTRSPLFEVEIMRLFLGLGLLRKLLIMTVLGFVAVTLIGPIVAVTGFIVAFAVIGFVILTMYRAVARVVGRWGRKHEHDREALRAALRGAGRFGRQACYHGAVLGRQACVQGAALGKRVAPEVVNLGRRAADCAAVPMRVGMRYGRDLAHLGRQVGERAARRGRLIGTMVREGVCGALVGAIVGLLLDWQAVNVMDVYTPAGALAGAAVGIVVAFSRREPVEEAGAST